MLVNSIIEYKPERKHPTTGEKMIDLASQTFKFSDDFMFDLVEVTSACSARPDIVSYNAYGTDKYGDLLCKINDISNPFAMGEGEILIVPRTEWLSSFFTQEKDSIDEDTESAHPVPKKKSQKRKPNEAVVGDTRFKIDRNSRVVIY